MNEDIFEGKWEEIKGKIKQKWGELTDNDLQQIEGNQQELCGKLQKYYGYSREQAEREIKHFREHDDEY